MFIQEHSPRLKVDLSYLHNISRIKYLSIVDLLCLRVVQVQIGLRIHVRFLRWSKMSDLWFRLGWR